jgi:hypothetical protein
MKLSNSEVLWDRRLVAVFGKATKGARPEDVRCALSDALIESADPEVLGVRVSLAFL